MSAIAAIHAGLRQLGIDQDDARDLYERQTGKRSLREMNPRQQEAIVEELRRLGFRKASKPSSKPLQGPFAKKLQALWIDAWNLGIVEDRSDAALLAFVRRQTRIDHTRFLTRAADAARVIDALKAWLAREAGVDWSKSRFLPAWTQTDGYRIASAQFAVLRRAGAMPDFAELQHWVCANVGGCPAVWNMTGKQWQDAMNALGVLVRKAARR